MSYRQAPAPVRASATGKVMLTGGYLVLDRPNPCLVLSVNARFYASVTNLKIPIRRNATSFPMVVYTPQRCKNPTFLDLKIAQDPDGPISIRYVSGDEKNKFVECAIRASIGYLRSVLSGDEFNTGMRGGLLIHLTGDQQFYSAGEPNDQSERKTTKTGLGSSAALVAALVAGIFAQFQYLKNTHDNNPSQSRQHHEAHIVAQYAHCLAQGKVGSGFDVSAAFFGSQRYTRFSLSCLEELIRTPITSLTPTLISQYVHVPEQVDMKQKTSERAWDYVAKPFLLPPQMHLLLGDVEGGSETPGMVKKVLAWHKSAKDTKCWNDLIMMNRNMEQALRTVTLLAEEHPKMYTKVITGMAKVSSSQWSQIRAQECSDFIVRRVLVDAIMKVRNLFEQVRALLRALGTAAGVPIEPEEQTARLNTTMNVNGCLFAGVPGAGGHDAIFAIVLGDVGVQALEQEWKTHGIARIFVDVDDVIGVHLQDTPVTMPVTPEQARDFLASSQEGIARLTFSKSMF